jgi:hypothetical protein
MKIRYHVTGEARKALVRAIGEILDCAPVYRGAPTFTYLVSACVIDKDGTLFCPSQMPREDIRLLVAALKERGYAAENFDEVMSDENNRLVIEMPGESFSDEAVQKLTKIIASKETLIKKALCTDSLAVEVRGDKLCFPWFTLHGLDGEADAYSCFVSAICKMAREQKRVTAKERVIENDKFTMRLFLIRLGFVGNEYKLARKILLRNLTGNSSFKNGQRPAVTAENDEGGSTL